MKILETRITEKTLIDKLGWKITKGTEIYIIAKLKNPMTQKNEIIALIDNGTGDYNLMPKTLIEEWKK